MTTHTLDVSDTSFDAEVLQAAQPVLVDFWGSFCAPCKILAPILDTVAQGMAGKVTVAKLNIEENPLIPSKYGVRAVPTLMVFKGGKPIATKVGAMQKAQLVQWLETLV